MDESTLSRSDLALAISEGLIDTVIVAFPDLQGRVVGKRMTGWFFLRTSLITEQKIVII